MTKDRKILNFIEVIRNSHPEMKNIFLYGSCLNFHLILKSIYPEAIPYTNIDHIITKIGNKFYDISGRVYNTKSYEKMGTIYFPKKRESRSFTQQYNYYLNLKN